MSWHPQWRGGAGPVLVGQEVESAHGTGTVEAVSHRSGVTVDYGEFTDSHPPADLRLLWTGKPGVVSSPGAGVGAVAAMCAVLVILAGTVAAIWRLVQWAI